MRTQPQRRPVVVLAIPPQTRTVSIAAIMVAAITIIIVAVIALIGFTIASICGTQRRRPTLRASRGRKAVTRRR
jgi:hypothetical protein